MYKLKRVCFSPNNVRQQNISHCLSFLSQVWNIKISHWFVLLLQDESVAECTSAVCFGELQDSPPIAVWLVALLFGFITLGDCSTRSAYLCVRNWLVYRLYVTCADLRAARSILTCWWTVADCLESVFCDGTDPPPVSLSLSVCFQINSKCYLHHV